MSRLTPLLERSRRHFRALKPAWRSCRRLARYVPSPAVFGSRRPHRPAGYYARVEDYLEKNPGAGVVNEIYPREQYARPMPHTMEGGPPHPIFAPLGEVTVAAPKIIQLYGARYWGYNAGVIIGRDNKLLHDLSPDVWGIESHRAFAQWRYPPCRHIKGVVAVLSTAEADRNYWHWTYELLPRIHYLAKANFGPETVDYYVINHRGRPFQLEALPRLGLPPEKILLADERLHFTADHLLTTSLKTGQLQISRRDTNWLRDDFGAVQDTRPFRRLYLSRRGCAFRRILNESEIEPILRAQKFEIFEPDKLSLAEQITRFAEAKVIVGPHGSAFTNTVFASPEAVIAEVIPESYVDPAFWAVSTAVGQRHLVDYTPGASGLDYTHVCRQDDFRVNPARIGRWLEWVLAESAKPREINVPSVTTSDS
jgi:capsular polysaccharide biosynthesis protein